MVTGYPQGEVVSGKIREISGDLSSLPIDLCSVAGRVLGGNPFLLT